MLLAAGADFWRWQPHPEVWVLVGGVAALAVYALRVVGPKVVPAGQPVVTRAQLAWFGLGLVLLWVASDWPIHDIGEEYLFSVHMTQHMLLTYVVPPVMLLATPEWLARLVLGRGLAKRVFSDLPPRPYRQHNYGDVIEILVVVGTAEPEPVSTGNEAF